MCAPKVQKGLVHEGHFCSMTVVWIQTPLRFTVLLIFKKLSLYLQLILMFCKWHPFKSKIQPLPCRKAGIGPAVSSRWFGCSVVKCCVGCSPSCVGFVYAADLDKLSEPITS